MPGPVLLVEGESDRTAVLRLAVRLGHALDGVEVVAMGGITNLGRHLGSIGGDGPVAVLHDAGEAPYVDRTLARHEAPVARFVCRADLEDELVRALGVPAVLEVVALAGDLPRWETLRNQPFHRERPEEAVLRRFFGTTSGRKDRYASLLVAALDLDRVPGPLLGAIAAVSR